jgi:hypothetical protein
LGFLSVFNLACGEVGYDDFGGLVLQTGEIWLPIFVTGVPLGSGRQGTPRNRIISLTHFWCGQFWMNGTANGS